MTRILGRTGLAAMLALTLWAGGSTAWESHTWGDFIRGRFQNVALTRDGRLTMAAPLVTLAETGEAAVWAAALAPDGSYWLATGHRGRLLRARPNQPLETVWAAPQPEIFALTVARDGAVFAGTSPDGRIWRISGNTAEEWFNPQAKYIWALAIGPDGALYAGTGDQGQIWRVSAKGQGEIYYATEQTHVTSLAFDSQRRLLAGSDPNGLLYRIEAKDQAFVLHDSPLQEIRAIVPEPGGSLLVAALGPAAAQKQAQTATSSAAGFQQVPSVTTTITVTAEASRAQAGLEVKPQAESAKPPATEAAQPPQAPIEIPGVEKTAIYRIQPDNTVETLWSSKDENIFDLALQSGAVYFSTDGQGRVYRLNGDLQASLEVETREGEATRLLATPQGLLTATASLGKLYRLGPQHAPAGVYESPVHDAGSAARWGRLDWRGAAGAGRVAIHTRSGNSLRPDKTWSAWTASDGAIRSPNARYIQYKVELQAGAGTPPEIESITLHYQPQNNRPNVRSLQVTPQWGALLSKSVSPAAASATAAYSITVSDTGDSTAASSGGTPTQTVNRTGVQQLLISWQADDPDNDRLVYTLSYRGEDERAWKLIKEDMAENTHLLEADVFADGLYRFRVVASDKLANSAATARQAELVSPPVLIDQTPPLVTLTSPQRDGATVTCEAQARDGASPIRRAEFSLDAGPWQPLDAADGVADSLTETFLIRLSRLSAGEHTLVVRAFDASGNAGLAKVVIR